MKDLKIKGTQPRVNSTFKSQIMNFIPIDILRNINSISPVCNTTIRNTLCNHYIVGVPWIF